MLEVPDDLLEERRRTGADRWDEMWDGVLHMVPAPGGLHQLFNTRLAVALVPRAEARGLVGMQQAELYRPGVGRRDYRIPDLVFCRPERLTRRGVEGRAVHAVEVRSPNDETYQKLAFYAEMQLQELLVVHPYTCAAELFVLREGLLVPAGGPLYSAALDVTFATVVTTGGPVLRVAWPGGWADVHGRA